MQSYAFILALQQRSAFYGSTAESKFVDDLLMHAHTSLVFELRIWAHAPFEIQTGAFDIMEAHLKQATSGSRLCRAVGVRTLLDALSTL